MRYLCALLVLAVAPSFAAADVVLDWNTTALDIIRETRTSPPVAARALAMAHAAMFDAANAIDHRFDSYKVTRTEERSASVEAAIAQAGHDVLVALFPQQSERLAKALRRSLNEVQEGAAKDAGAKIGENVADRIVRLRMNDGADRTATYRPGGRPGEWRPTLPEYQDALLPNWIGVTPFAMSGGSQFRSPRPPALQSDEYAANFQEVKRLGSRDSTERTAEQTEIAWFWEDGAGTATPPGHWNEIAQSIAREENRSPIENARLFALLNVTLADAAIACWDSKFNHHLWRPIAAIREADTDGNSQTEKDPNWLPLIDTPPFPSCASGHSAFSGAAARILDLYTGADQRSFTVTSERSQAPRSFTSFSQAAEEAGKSRIYGGIHFEVDNRSGLEMGQNIADYVFKGFMQPLDSNLAAAELARREALRPDGAQSPQLTFKDEAPTETTSDPVPVATQPADQSPLSSSVATTQSGPTQYAPAPVTAAATQLIPCETQLATVTPFEGSQVAPIYEPAPVTTTLYAPETTVASAPVQYAPATTAYYAAAAPQSAPVTTSYYAPTTTYYSPAPTTTFYQPAPRAVYYAPQPVTSYYSSSGLFSGARTVFFAQPTAAPVAVASPCCGGR